MIRRLIYWVLLLFVCMGAHAQFRVTAHQEGWDRIPPPAQKEVMLFGRDNGHYPTFDLFKFYYVIVDNYTKEIQYISDEIYVTDKYALTVEDRNNDGISELYIDYFKDGKFTVDERGYNLRTTRCYDRIEWSPESEKFNPQQP